MEYQIKNISPNNLEQCIKCTICTVYCPVLAVNPDYPGPKQAGPDGERYRLKNPEFYDAALKYCLNCKRCEVACPSNVKIGDIIQTARIRYDKRQVSLRDRMLASTDFMGKMATSMSFIVNTALRMPLTKSVMDFTLGIDHHRNFPTYSSETFESWMRRKAPDQSSFPRRFRQLQQSGARPRLCQADECHRLRSQPAGEGALLRSGQDRQQDG